MPDAAADPITALVEALKGDEATSALVDVRVFGGELPDDETKNMPRAAIVLAPSGGVSLTGGSYARHDTCRVDLFAYGATARAAKQLADTADLALRGLRRTVLAATLVHWVKPAGGAIDSRDPDAAWPRSFRSYQVFAALAAVA